MQIKNGARALMGSACQKKARPATRAKQTGGEK